MRVRYGRWTGTQEPFPAEVGADDVIDAIAEDVIDGLPPEMALRRLVQRGMQGRVAGLRELRRRVEQARRREAARMGVDDPLRAFAERLEEILDRERTALDFEVRPEAEEARRRIAELPEGLAARMRELDEHRWVDAQAGADYRALREELRRDVAEATFGRMASALGSLQPEDIERMGQMLTELNALITADARGEDIDEAFRDFAQRYADLLPEGVSSLDELLAELAQRMAAMSRMMATLDHDQRAELAALADQVLGSAAAGEQAQALQDALRARYPHLGWDEGLQSDPFGAPAGSVSEAVDWVEHLAELEDLEQALAQDYPGARLEDIDADALRRALGEDAARDLAGLREIERVLEEAGALHRHEGRLEITPRGVRTLGERALIRVFERTVTGLAGGHGTPAGGGDGELTGATRPLAFGDPFRLDVARTIGNAVMRRAASGAATEDAPAGVRLRPEDFELAEAERRVRAATVLLLDMSFSMPLRGNWGPAKRVALALQALIASRFPEDRFSIVGFSDYARRLQPADLLSAGWERVYGTNMEHAFMLARRLLAAHPADEHQVIMITDGEPTAHLEGDQAVFAWPPEPETLRRTLVEAARLARTGATMNVFLLDHDPGAAAFVERMVTSYGGRIFYPDLDDLGSMVVRDFLHRRRG